MSSYALSPYRNCNITFINVQSVQIIINVIIVFTDDMKCVCTPVHEDVTISHPQEIH